MLREDRLCFWVLAAMRFEVEAGAENLPWVRAILAKEEHARRPESNRLGHWTAEEWQNKEAYVQPKHQQRATYQYAQ